MLIYILASDYPPPRGCWGWAVSHGVFWVAEPYFPGMHGAERLMANRTIRGFIAEDSKLPCHQNTWGACYRFRVGAIPSHCPLPSLEIPFMGLGEALNLCFY